MDRRLLWIMGLSVTSLGIYSATTSRKSIFDALAGGTYHHGSKRTKRIAFTFDDGPSPVYTEMVLNILEAYQVRATFFMIGKNVAKWPDVAREVAKRGHIIGNHTFSHSSLPLLSRQLVESEIQLTDQVILEKVGVFPKFARPPHGHRDLRVLGAFRRLQHPVVFWSVSPTDWANPGIWTIVRRTVNKCHNGAIILFHDGMAGTIHAASQDSIVKRLILGVADRLQTVSALPQIITLLRSRGFDLVTVPELLGPDIDGNIISCEVPLPRFAT